MTLVWRAESELVLCRRQRKIMQSVPVAPWIEADGTCDPEG